MPQGRRLALTRPMKVDLKEILDALSSKEAEDALMRVLASKKIDRGTKLDMATGLVSREFCLLNNA